MYWFTLYLWIMGLLFIFGVLGGITEAILKIIYKALGGKWDD